MRVGDFMSVENLDDGMTTDLSQPAVESAAALHRRDLKVQNSLLFRST